ncbi:hypothetical protein [Evansella halocellulosilytica]|uniref:hypothetical protein n=1 Tax=Evansella halocellulosilytica TaxID=2011013 RepID=UPI00211D0043|nr:hypothetical protein [Evansella halocellulosilytica]
MDNFQRLSLNQITTEQWNVKEAINGCQRSGIPYIGIWRHKIKEYGFEKKTTST